jgi:hypothetical protein
LSLAAGARRLFPHYDEADLTLDRARSLLIARLLEDGDAADLARLLSTVSEPAVADWFARHGGRQLSRRSRAFWEIVLGRPAGPAHPEAESLWPL